MMMMVILSANVVYEVKNVFIVYQQILIFHMEALRVFFDKITLYLPKNCGHLTYTNQLLHTE